VRWLPGPRGMLALLATTGVLVVLAYGAGGQPPEPHARSGDRLRSFHLTYPMLRDPGGQAKAEFGGTGFPESFVIDRTGRVAALERGPIDDAFM
jgi:hypothetical protein